MGSWKTTWAENLELDVDAVDGEVLSRMGSLESWTLFDRKRYLSGLLESIITGDDTVIISH